MKQSANPLMRFKNRTLYEEEKAVDEKEELLKERIWIEGLTKSMYGYDITKAKMTLTAAVSWAKKTT